MSRWTEAFNAHAFQATWQNLKAALDATVVDDESVTTSVIEIARLKKVTAYLDEIILGIDPELVPPGTWDNSNAQAEPCYQQIMQYTNNRNIAHIRQANAHADNLLTYLRPYMVSPRSVGSALQRAVKTYAKTIDEYGTSLSENSNGLLTVMNEHITKSKKLLESIEETKAKVDQFDVELFGDGDANVGIQSAVNKQVSEFEKKYDELVQYYNETLVGSPTEISTKKEVSQAKESVLSDRAEIGELLDNVSYEVDELGKFYVRIFGKTNAEDGRKEGGLAGELDERIKAITEFESKQKIKYQALNAQIETLLPGATSAGLASAYHDMKLSFNDSIRNSSRLFFASIGMLMLGSIALSIQSIEWPHITFLPIGELDSVLKGLLYKAPFYGPALWLAFYASKRRSEYQRLQQEYAHKEALAKSYDSYKKQIEALGDDNQEMQRAFILKAIDAIAYNASNTLDKKHGDKMPTHDMLDKLVEGVASMKEMLKAK